LFATLLQNRVANRFEQSYETISGLCQRWGREVSARPDPFQAELKALPPRSAAAHSSGTGEYQPYVMDDVREASAARKFTVAERFLAIVGSPELIWQAISPTTNRTLLADLRREQRHYPVDHPWMDQLLLEVPSCQTARRTKPCLWEHKRECRLGGDAVIAGYDDPAAETMRRFDLPHDLIVRVLNEAISGCEGQDIRNWKKGE
jgi:hypothetical protein